MEKPNYRIGKNEIEYSAGARIINEVHLRSSKSELEERTFLSCPQNYQPAPEHAPCDWVYPCSPYAEPCQPDFPCMGNEPKPTENDPFPNCTHDCFSDKPFTPINRRI